VVEEELLPGEATLYQRNEKGITTLTWFRGDVNQATNVLENRLTLILQRNPWLAGRVCPKRGKLYLTFRDNNDVPLNLMNKIDSSESRIHRRTRLDQLAQACQSSNVFVENGPNEPLLKVSLIPCRYNPHSQFALIVSLSHIVADGFTYYQIMEMLCHSDETKDDEAIRSMIYHRIVSSPQQQAQALGQVNYDAFVKPGPAFFLTYLGGIVRARTLGPEPLSVFCLVDSETMSQEKTRAIMNDNGNHHPASGATTARNVPFCSTNDILTSWFFQNSDADVGAMAINFRNRLQGHTNNHAGNYESILLYRRPDSAHPTLIRQSLLDGDNQYRRPVTGKDPVPSFWEALGTTSALVTNWSSFAKPNFIPNCQEELHVPLYDLRRSVPTGSSVLIIFRAGPDKGTGLYLVGEPTTLRKLGFSRWFTSRPSFVSSQSVLS
jgi:hypothetical protein